MLQNVVEIFCGAQSLHFVPQFYRIGIHGTKNTHSQTLVRINTVVSYAPTFDSALGQHEIEAVYIMALKFPLIIYLLELLYLTLHTDGLQA